MPDKLGILTLDPASRQEYFDQMAHESKKYGTDLYSFSPLDLLPGTQKAKGLHFDTASGIWKEEVFQIPEFLYDRCFYGEDQPSKDAKKIVAWLKERKDLTFLGYGLPNKAMLYDRLKEIPEISPYLPETVKADSTGTVLRELNKYLSIILKPANGAHGYAVYSLEKRTGGLLVSTTKNGSLISRNFDRLDRFQAWLNKLLGKHDFLIQARIDNMDRKNRPFDLRIFLQKDSHGEWQEVARGIRTGMENGILTNLSAGASLSTYENWQRETPHFNHVYISQEISDIISTLPAVLEETFQPLFELGIDLLIAGDQSIWILDINSKPGRKMVSLLHPEKTGQMAEAPLAYCRHLQETESRARANIETV